MATILMPRATAVWLIENTALTFEQIAQFCHLHLLEIQTLADAETQQRITGLDPITSGQLSIEEIHRCEKDSAAHLVLKPDFSEKIKLTIKKSKYTPLSKRQDRPDAIAWLLKYHPELSDYQICKLVGTTKNTVQSVKQKTHWNSPNIKPRDPVNLGLCSQSELNERVNEALKDKST